MPSSRGSSQPRDRTLVSYSFRIGRQVLYHRATWESHNRDIDHLSKCYFRGVTEQQVETPGNMTLLGGGPKQYKSGHSLWWGLRCSVRAWQRCPLPPQPVPCWGACGHHLTSSLASPGCDLAEMACKSLHRSASRQVRAGGGWVLGALSLGEDNRVDWAEKGWGCRGNTGWGAAWSLDPGSRGLRAGWQRARCFLAMAEHLFLWNAEVWLYSRSAKLLSSLSNRPLWAPQGYGAWVRNLLSCTEGFKGILEWL